MVKVLKKVEDNAVMIIFVLMILLLTIYMGMNERRLDDINSSNPTIINMK